MARDSLDESSPQIGRFDKSFLIHMIRDFFVILVAVTVLEFSLKAALVYYKFRVSGPERSQQVAEDIADNVRSIMRNEGGPVAARTVYPILESNWNDLGYLIAIVPSPVTTRSIEQGFGFLPQLQYGDAVQRIMELEPVRKHMVGSLSYGFQKKVEVARALTMDPEILLLDEPTSALDAASKRKVAELLLDSKRTIISTSHDPFWVERADRLIELD